MTKKKIGILICLFMVCAVALTATFALLPETSENTATEEGVTYYTGDSKDALTDYEENVAELSVPMVMGNETVRAGAEDVVYLSDLPYLSHSAVGWGSLLMDKTDTNGARITLNMNGSWVSFDKGIYAHADSNIYYDLHDYTDYKYFTTYFGVNSTSNNKGDGVKFWVYTSNDPNKNWVFRGDESQTIMKSGNSCGYLKIDVTGYRYLRLQCFKVGNNANDHSCWADAKLVKEGHREFVTMTVDEYDEEIRSQYDRKNVMDDELELLVLQRYLVNKIGAYQLNQLYKYAEYAETFEWLFNDIYLMRTFINGGAPEGTWFNAFAVLSRLYHAYGDDLTDERLAGYNVPYKEVFAKQMFAISLVYSKQVAFWIKSSGNANPNTNISDPVVRYGIYKNLFLAGKLNSMYARLEVEEMRVVVWGEFADDEAYWLNDYTRTSGKSLYAPYSFTFYKKTEPYEYRQAKYYGDNRKAYESKYKLTGYNIANDKYYPKSWMIMQNGGQCWEIAILCNTILNVNGIPAYSVVQWPAGKTGHQAFLSAWMNGNGDLNWGLYNDAYGWDESTTINVDGDTRRLYTMRLPLGWGHGDYVTKKGQATYIFLGQAALNNYSQMCKAAAYVKLADSYKDVLKKEEIYKKALGVQSIHFDAWLNLVDLYRTSVTKTDEELASFISDMCDKLKGYPLPMYDLHRRIVGLVKDSRYQITANGAKEQALNWCSANGGGAAKVIANTLLGKSNQKTVSFSFTSTPANKLVFQAAKDSDSSFTWDYSIDGGATWTTVWEGGERILTHEEVDSLSASKDILVHIIGLPYTTANYFKVDLVNGSALTVFTCANNNEKQMMGVTANMEWRYVGDEVWNRSWGSLNLNGEVKVEVRNAAKDNCLPGPAKVFTFTETDSSPEHTYISVLKNVTYSPSVLRCSSENSSSTLRYNVFDTLYQGGWVSKYDSIPYIDVELANPTYVSRVQWISATGRTDGIPVNMSIYAGVNGTNWPTLAARVTGLQKTDNYINVDFTPVYTKYLRIAFDKTTSVSSGKYLVQVGELAIFRDITKIAPDIDVQFSTFEPTNTAVTATLTPALGVTLDAMEGLTYNESAGNYTYVFEENERLTLTYRNASGAAAFATVDVDWIDKIAPKFKFAYNTTTATNGNVTVVCNTYELVEFIQEGGKNFHTFEENGEFTFIIKDAAGNITEATAKVTVIDRSVPTATVSYLPKRETDYPVTVDIVFDKRVELLNDNGEFVDQGDGTAYKYVFRKNGSYELIFKDMVGNVGSTLLSVDWIRPGLAETFVTYVSDEAVDPENQFNSTTTSGNVTATLTFDENDPVTVTNNGGSFTYVFYENGSFEFEFVDSRGNVGKAIADVSWIEKELPVTLVTFDKTANCGAPVKATFVSEESVTIINNGGSAVYNFAENGTFTFMYNYVTSEGKTLVGVTHATVDWIDSTPPTADVKFNYEAYTDCNVVVTIIPSEEVTVTNNGGSFTYTFTENGEFTFLFRDSVGLTGSKTVTVDWIDRTRFASSVIYDVTETTGGTVTATLLFDDYMFPVVGERVRYEFTENGSHVFLYEDASGKVGGVTAKVTWIDKVLPQGTVTYNVASGVTVTSKDNLPVVATLTTDKPVTILNNGGSNERNFEYNGSFTFEFMDEAGNVGTATATVNCIKVRATVWIEYSTKDQSAPPVRATVKSDRPITVTSYGGASREFNYNGEFTFTWRDEAGYNGSETINITWINDNAPKATVSYSTNSATSGNVIATVRPASGSRDIMVTAVKVYNADGSLKETKIVNMDITNFVKTESYSYEFTDNGRIAVVFCDSALNANSFGSVGAQVTWIDRTVPVATATYDRDTVSCEPVTARIAFNKSGVIISDTDYPYTKNADGSYSIRFEDNGTLRVNFRDAAGNVNYVDVEVNCIDKVLPVATVEYDVTALTSGNVNARLTFTKPSVILNEDLIYTRHSDGSYSVLISQNGAKTVTFRDGSGNENTVDLEVDWIDKTVPEVSVTFSVTDFTIHDVTAYLTFSEEVVIVGDGITSVADEEGIYSLIFTKNCTQRVRFRDLAGNENVRDIKVDWIDRLFQEVSVSYSTEETTNSDVIATLTFNCDVEILNLDVEAVRVSEGVYTVTFATNADYEIRFRDEDGYEGSLSVAVSWIDKEAPTAHVEYSTRNHTNEDVIATIHFFGDTVKITSEHIGFDYVGGGVYTMLFTENGSHLIEFEDELGNKNSAIVAVNWIDRELPTVTVSFDVESNTNGEVNARLIFSEEVYLEYIGFASQDAASEHVLNFTENGSVVVSFRDVAGNSAEYNVTVDWIDKTAPVAYVGFDSEEPTSGQVTAIIHFSEPVTILSDVEYVWDGDALNIVFKNSGSVTLLFEDEAGNAGEQVVEVNWIFDQTPEVEVTFDITSPTRDNVTVTLTFSVPVTAEIFGTVLNKISDTVYTFIAFDNGDFTLNFSDGLGNSGSRVITVDWIDRSYKPHAVTYNTTALTNRDVIVRVECSEGIRYLVSSLTNVRNKDGSFSVIVPQNGEYSVIVVHEDGGEGEILISVDWIDKETETVALTYSEVEETAEDVVVTLNFLENVEILSAEVEYVRNDDGSYSLNVTENGTYTVRYAYADGTEDTVTVTVDWINKPSGNDMLGVIIGCSAAGGALVIAGVAVAVIMILKKKKAQAK